MDRIAHCALEINLLFMVLTLITGSIWGRPTWGVWWAWDARLTSTAIQAVLILGYLALRRANDDPDQRARRAAVFAMIITANIPVIHFSVLWWKTLHQGATVFTANGNILVHGSMAWTLLLSFLAFTALFFWLLRQRYRLEERRDALGDVAVREALLERQREGR
jgi:heme exporter protein C